MKKTEIIIKYIREYFDENKVPLHRPLFKGNEKKYLNEVIESTYVSTSGQFINQSQNHLKKTTKANHVSTLVNGSSALQIALQIAGVNSGDEVLTQAISFIATSNAIINNGAYPVFLDSDIKITSTIGTIHNIKVAKGNNNIFRITGMKPLLILLLASSSKATALVVLKLLVLLILLEVFFDNIHNL